MVSNLEIGDRRNYPFIFNEKLTFVGYDEELERIGFYQKNGDSFEFLAETTESVYNAPLWTPFVIGEDGLLYFDGWTEEHGGGLYSTNGQPGNQVFLGNPEQTLPYDVGSLTFIGDKLFHYADPENIGRELHVVSTEVTSLEEQITDFSVRYYPNPVKDRITIEGNFTAEIREVSLTDLSGMTQNLSIQKSENKLVVDIPEGISGVGFITLVLLDGNTKSVKIIQ